MTAALAYIRVSLLRAGQEKESPDVQLGRIRQYADLYDLALADVYRDLDVSGRTDRRPAFREMMERVDRGGISHVLVYSFDRFARSTRDFHRWASYLEERGVALVSVSQNIDTSTPVGRLIRSILASFAEFESELLAQRTGDALRSVAGRGRWPGGVVPYGYRVEPRHGLAIEPEQARWVRWIYRRYLQGDGTRVIAERLREMGVPAPEGGSTWHYGTVNGILTNPVYAGRFRWSGEEWQGNHEPIIEPAQLEAAGEIMGRNYVPRPAAGGGNHRPFSGLLRCGLCGATANVRHRHGRVRYYCTRRMQHGRRECPNVAVDEGSAERIVLDRIRRLVTAEAVRQRAAAQPGDDGAAEEIRRLDARLRQLRGITDRLFRDHYEAGIISREQFVEQNGRYLEERERIELRLAELRGREAAAAQMDAEVVSGAVDVIRTAWDHLEPAERRLALRQVIREIRWDQEGVEIRWHLGPPERLVWVRVLSRVGYLDTGHQHECPECGQPCDTPAGLASHRRRRHRQGSTGAG